MKEALSLTIAALGLPIISFFTTTVQAQDYEYVTTNGTVTITRYTGPGGDVTIPGTISGLPVTSIVNAAFRSNTSLTSITMPNSVKEIHDLAFAECPNLARVTFGTNLTVILGDTFLRCTSLASVTIPDSVTTIGDMTFCQCTGLTNVTIGKGLRGLGTVMTEPSGAAHSLGGRAFHSCTSLRAITVDPLNPVFSSAEGVLFNKAKTTLIAWPGGKQGAYNIPAGVTNLEDEAFSDCGGMTSLTVPASLAYIGYPGLNRSTNLTSITVDPLNSMFSSLDGVWFSKGRTALIRYPGGRPGNYIIPDSVSHLWFSAFADCINLTSVVIPDGVTGIAQYAFSGCTSLTNINIPSRVTSIDEEAFSHCSRLTSVTMPGGLTYIADRGFSDCSSLTAIYFQGNAPRSTWYWGRPFRGSSYVIVYYLPGTSGWGSTFADRPTAPWVLPYPIALTAAPGFGMQTNKFAFRISWATNASVVVEATAALVPPVWSPISTNTLTEGWCYFSDSEWANYPTRSYRIRKW